MAANLLVVVIVSSVALSACALADVAPLTGLSPEEVRIRCENDLRSAAIYREGLSSVLQFAGERPDLFPVARREELRLLPRDEKAVALAAWQSLLDYNMALDSLARYHAPFYNLKGKPQKVRSFTVRYAVFLAQYRFAMDFINLAENNPPLDTILNDPMPELGLREGTYAKYKLRFLNVARATEFVALNSVARLYGEAEDETTRAAIAEDKAAIWRMGRGKGELLTLANGLNILKKAGFDVYLPVQTGISEWMGDTKVLRKGSTLVSQEQIAEALPQLRPGDVMFTRREWYLSNVGLPGFWPHAALYIGTPEERQRSFAGDEVAEWVRARGRPDGDFEALLRQRHPEAYALCTKPQELGHVPRVLEAMGEGVIFTSIEHSAAADSWCVLRPRLPAREKAIALLRAFGYSGRPYDFNFDFMTDSALVCTELVYKSYETSGEMRGLDLPLLTVLGRKVTPANEIVRQFDADYGTERQQFDLILFLDGHERRGRAAPGSLAEFRRSHLRPKWHVLVQKPPDR